MERARRPAWHQSDINKSIVNVRFAGREGNALMSRQVTHWTKEQKTQAAIHYAIYGSLAKIERDLGIPKSTACIWKNKGDAVWVDTVEQVQTEKGAKHRAMYVKIVDKAQKRTLKALPKANAAQAHLIACQATDKVRLHDGMPTLISGKAEDYQALAKQFKELSETWDEKQVGVVSVQEKSEEESS